MVFDGLAEQQSCSITNVIMVPSVKRVAGAVAWTLLEQHGAGAAASRSRRVSISWCHW